MPDWGDEPPDEYRAFIRQIQAIPRRLRETNSPVIAAMDGPTIGPRCDFALAADLLVVRPALQLRKGYVRVGLIPVPGGGWLLSRLISESEARGFLLTGRDITAEEAVDLGLAVTEWNYPTAEATALAERLRDLPASALRKTKELIDPTSSPEEYQQRAVEQQAECVSDSEHEEALVAFAEDREPDYDEP